MKDAHFHAVLFDEVTSHNQEQLALCVRFVWRKYTSMWASTGQNILSSLALMHIHYDIPVDVENTVDLFARNRELKNVITSRCDI